jgi:hypothetical protein
MTADQAWDNLRHLAKLLRARLPIPDDLADFIAVAVEATEGKDIEDRRKAKALTDELGLTALNRRKIEIPLQEVQIERDFGDDPSQNKFASRLAEHYSVTPSTILGRVHEAEEERRRAFRADYQWLCEHASNDD